MRLGRKYANVYQLVLCVIGMAGLFLGMWYKFYFAANIRSGQFYALIFGVFFPIILLLLIHVKNMFDIAAAFSEKNQEENRQSYNGQLKFLSLTTLGASVVYALIAFLYA